MSDGGPAFPSFQTFEKFDEDRGKYVEHTLPAGGMSLRQWYAGQALAGYTTSYMGSSRRAYIASLAFAMADAMLAAGEDTARPVAEASGETPGASDAPVTA